MSTATREPLTKRQQQVYDVIRDFIASHGYSPTYREIGAALGITSTNGVMCNVKRLVAKGWVAFRKDASRTLHVIDELGATGDVERLLATAATASELLRRMARPRLDLPYRPEPDRECLAAADGLDAAIAAVKDNRK